MNTDRRSFLALSGAAAAAAIATPRTARAHAPDPGTERVPGQAAGSKPRRNPIGISTYSYWRFNDDSKLAIEDCILRSAEFGFDGVEILHMQMPQEDNAYLQMLKSTAHREGLCLMGFSTHQSFIFTDAAKRKENVEHTNKCIEIAYELGCPSIRINTGRWGTSKDFDELMKNRGIEPILPGYTEEDGFKWCIEGIQRCLPKAEECGVILALENHWGLARTPEGLLRILNSISSPWLGGLMDTGNFLEEPYPKLAMIAPKTVYVQAKTYHGGGEWYSLDLDYGRIAKILGDVGYPGWISLEMEGKENPDTAVPKSLKTLRKAFGG